VTDSSVVEALARARVHAVRSAALAAVGLAAGAAWVEAADGAVPRPFWLLAVATIGCAVWGLAASVRARSAPLAVMATLLLVATLYGTFLAVLAYALSEFTF
jgi:hypothetical protein